MFNLYPGQGLGLQAHKELAFGLGAFEEVPVEEEVQEYYGGRYEWDQIYTDRLITEDEEILQIIIEALTSGVFE